MAKLSIDFSNANSLQFLRKLTSARIRYSYIKSVSIVKIRGEVKYLKDLLDYCFPLKLQNLTIDFDPTFIDKKYYFDSILKWIAKTTKVVQIGYFTLSAIEFQQIVIASCQVGKLQLVNCKIEKPTRLNFSNVLKSKIRRLNLKQYRQQLDDNYITLNPSGLECIVEAIAKSGIRLSLRALKVQSHEISRNEINELLIKYGLEKVKGVIEI